MKNKTSILICLIAIVVCGCTPSVKKSALLNVRLARFAVHQFDKNKDVNNGRLTRDIKSRLKANIYLSGMHSVILKEYPQYSLEIASLADLNARYRAAYLMASAEMQRNNK